MVRKRPARVRVRKWERICRQAGVIYTVAIVRFVLGMCGSGKTLWEEGAFNDGFKRLGEGRAPDLPGYVEVLACVRDDLDCTVAEIAYYFESNRSRVMADIRRIRPDAIVEWFCYSNDIDAANWNCRNDPGRQGT